MNQTEMHAVLHAYWCRQKDLAKRDADMLMFALAQDALARAGWIYRDQDGAYQSCQRLQGCA